MAAHAWPTGDGNPPNHQLPNHFPQLNPVYGLQQPADLFNPFIANAAALQQKVSPRFRLLILISIFLNSKISQILTDFIKK